MLLKFAKGFAVVVHLHRALSDDAVNRRVAVVKFTASS